MNIGHYESSNELKRLSGTIHQRGSQSGMSTVGAFVFGSPFVAIGILMILFGTQVLRIEPAKVHAPIWILAAFGACFTAGGFLVWNMGWRQLKAQRHRRDAARSHPDERAWQDYSWNPRGFTPPRWKPVFIGWISVLFLGLFLSMFNWWAFVKGGPVVLKIIVGIFDLILVFAVWQGIIKTGRAIKFGGSEIQFLSFPYRLNQPLAIYWRPASGIDRANKGSFTLRCIKEFWEVSGQGKNRSRHIVHEQVWRGTWRFEEARTFQPNETITLPFELDKNLPPTRLSDGEIVFWELEVKLDLPGLDFEERYLVPVY